MKGSRVQAVVQELRGEKIDIVPWDRDPARFVCNAIAPAEVVRVVIDEGNANMELVVPDAKLSLAIGRRGQNVRLASQLTEWKLDIVSESRFQQIEEEAMKALSRLSDDEEVARELYRMGFRSLDEVLDAGEAELSSVPGIAAEDLPALKERASVAMESLRQEALSTMAQREEAPTERERLMLIRGVNSRMADQLERSGYGSAEAIAVETDVDRLALKSGLGAQKSQVLKEAAQRFVREEWPAIEVQLQSNLERVREAAAAAERAEAAQAPQAQASAPDSDKAELAPESSEGQSEDEEA
jgi:N utilization substance protein A